MTPRQRLRPRRHKHLACLFCGEPLGLVGLCRAQLQTGYRLACARDWRFVVADYHYHIFITFSAWVEVLRNFECSYDYP